MTDSRELGAEPINHMSSSWLENVKFYSELEGDTALLNSADSVDCINWNTRDSGRPESPLHFDHEEILAINTSSTSEALKSSSGGASKAVTPTVCSRQTCCHRCALFTYCIIRRVNGAQRCGHSRCSHVLYCCRQLVV